MFEATEIVQKATQTVSIGEFLEQGTFSAFFNITTGIEMSPAEMRLHNISNIVQDGDEFVVTFTDGRGTVRMSGYDLVDMRNRR